MSPYVSGKLDKLLQSPETNSYKDLYPTPNTNWYYAVTMVNGEGQEEKTVDSKKVRFKNSFSLYITVLCFKNGFQLSHLVVYLDRTWRMQSKMRERKEREGSWEEQSERERVSPLFPFPLPLALPLTDRRLGTNEFISQSSQKIGVPVSLLVIT